jgi:hypothetical protein
MVVVEAAAGMGTSRFLVEARAAITDTTTGATESSDPAGLAIVAAIEDAIGASDETAQVRSGLQALAAGGRDLVAVSSASVQALEELASLARRHAPLVLFVDAPGLTTPSSLATFRYMQQRCQGAGIAIVTTARPGVASTACVSALEPTSITLGPLALEDLSVIELEDEHAPTGGHPVLIADAVRRLYSDEYDVSTISEDVRDRLIRSCLAFGPEAFELLSQAAGLDVEFRAEELAQLLGRDALDVVEELEDLCQASVVAVRGERFSFRYETVRQVLVDSADTPADLAHLTIDLTASAPTLRLVAA